MKQFLLAAVLIAAPVAAFSAFEKYYAAPAPSAASLGDMSAFIGIAADVRRIAATGDFTAAEKRITDLETAWDDAEATMRPLNRSAWGYVDDATDAALHALRSGSPDAADVNDTLARLAAALDDPLAGAGAAGGIEMVAGIAVTDASGHPVACEEMLTALSGAIEGGKVAQDKLAEATDFQAKATERCNADDDARADAFAAQGLALAAGRQ